MGSDWRRAKLGDLLEFQRGFDLPQQKRIRGQIPIVSSSGIADYHAEPRVTGPGVVTGRYGTVGKVFYLTEPFWPLNTTLWVKDFKGNDPKFIYYLLHTVDFNSCVDKSSVPGVNRNDLHLLPIKIPDIGSQEAIAMILSTLDNKIALNHQMCETLEKMAVALFRSWFVDFDPVRSKMDGRTPKGISADLLSLFPDRFENSEMGAIPSGWKISEIGKLVDAVGGATPSTKNPEFWEGRHFWATPKDLSALTHRVLLNTERKITDKGLNEISSGLLPEGTVLLSSRAPIGYVAVAEVPVAINQGFIAMKPSKKLGTQFALHWTITNLEKIKSHANGSTFQEISKGAFRPLKVCCPPQKLIESFEQIASSLHGRCVELVRQNNTLTKIRDTFLPRLISGELRVEDVEG